MSTAFTTCSRAYRALLILYPDDLRRTFGAEMAGVFEQQLADAWARSGIAGAMRVWLYVAHELFFVALPAQLAAPVVVVPMLSLISNSFLFLALLRALSPLAALCQYYGHR
jgi:hypothetical protein